MKNIYQKTFKWFCLYASINNRVYRSYSICITLEIFPDNYVLSWISFIEHSHVFQMFLYSFNDYLVNLILSTRPAYVFTFYEARTFNHLMAHIMWIVVTVLYISPKTKHSLKVNDTRSIAILPFFMLGLFLPVSHGLINAFSDERLFFPVKRSILHHLL